jgi:hypothetical protein
MKLSIYLVEAFDVDRICLTEEVHIEKQRGKESILCTGWGPRP